MEKEVTILTYVDHSFEQDLTFIDGLVKTRSRSFLIDPSQLEFEKVLSKYMIILWSLEAYPDLITGIKPEDRSQIQEFVEKKLLDFAKGEDLCFSPNIFMNALRKTSEAGMSELDFAQRDHITEPFKVKVVKDQEVISRRKRIINGLISEITLEIPTKLCDKDKDRKHANTGQIAFKKKHKVESIRALQEGRILRYPAVCEKQKIYSTNQSKQALNKSVN